MKFNNGEIVKVVRAVRQTKVIEAMNKQERTFLKVPVGSVGRVDMKFFRNKIDRKRGNVMYKITFYFQFPSRIRLIKGIHKVIHWSYGDGLELANEEEKDNFIAMEVAKNI
jgi:hypothetical protein